MEHARALKAGTMVAGDWRIERMLGAGGFGVTYEARHRTSGARAALKEYMPSGLCSRDLGEAKVTPAAGDAGTNFHRGMASFMQEAKTLARLEHPAIVRVHNFFEANGTAYMALAFEDGGTLADWLMTLEAQGKRPSQDQLDQLLWPLFEALIQVHSLPLLHRDIKPDNIMLRRDESGVAEGGQASPGSPVLIDFGGVRQLVSSASRSIAGPRPLDVVTDGYAPPEQYVALPNLLGPWTDVYALAATLYRCITGHAPPDADSRVKFEDYLVPLSKLAAEGHLPGSWRQGFLAGIDQGLSIRRADRPQSMLEFRRTLEVPPAAVPPREPRFAGSPAGDTADDVAAEPSKPTAKNTSPPKPESAPQPPLPQTAPFEDLLRPASRPRVSPRSGTVGALALVVAAAGWFAIMDGWYPFAVAPAPRPAAPKAEPGPVATAPAPQPAGAKPRPVVLKTETDPRPDAIAALTPGSGRSARDRLADDSPCGFCPEMVVVPAGSFTMGSPDGEPERFGTEDQVPVTIARPFAVGKFAVTFAEWDACVSDRGCNGYKPNDQGWGRGRRPVVNVNWDDANAYVKWLSGKTGNAYRLPSEAEREYVTRAGTTTPFWWGSSITSAQANYVGTVAPYKGGGAKGEYRRRTVPVDSFQPNPWGLYQVHGNVSEWTEDCWNESQRGNPGDGTARMVGCFDNSSRVIRGGSWDVNPRYLRSAGRSGYTSELRLVGLGFRVARTLNP